MKIYEFENNSQSMMFSYHRVREGPNYFVCYYKNSSTMKMDPKEAWRTLGAAKFTESGQALKAWCLSMHEQYGDHPKEDQGRADTSFASEAMNEEDPTADTKMVT